MVVLEAKQKQNGNGDDLLKVAFLVGWSAADDLHLARLPEMFCLGMGAAAAVVSISYNDDRSSHHYQYPPVASEGGDALPELLPVPGDFDHVIVRARIADADYWLDGTSTATRLPNIGEVPPFHYALPLRAGGADLMPIPQRDNAVPDMRMAITVDHSAGIDLPQMFTMSFEMSGAAGAAVEAMADANDPEMRRSLASSFTERNGFDEFMPKPLDRRILLETIGRIMGVPTSF